MDKAALVLVLCLERYYDSSESYLILGNGEIKTAPNGLDWIGNSSDVDLTGVSNSIDSINGHGVAFPSFAMCQQFPCQASPQRNVTRFYRLREFPSANIFDFCTPILPPALPDVYHVP